LVVSFISFNILLIYAGLWSALIQFLTHGLSMLFQVKIPLSTTVWGIDTAIMPLGLYFYKFIRIVCYRISNEEKMMEEHFGKEWEIFASQRCRLVPWIY